MLSGRNPASDSTNEIISFVWSNKSFQDLGPCVCLYMEPTKRGKETNDGAHERVSVKQIRGDIPSEKRRALHHIFPHPRKEPVSADVHSIGQRDANAGDGGSD